jgi:hypothetical protein
MGMEHEDLLAGDPGPAATRDNLEGVLRRHLRRRRRFTGGIAAAVLAIGAGGGVAIGEAVASGGGQVALSPTAAARNLPGTPNAIAESPSASVAGGVAPGHTVSGTAVPPTGLAWQPGTFPTASPYTSLPATANTGGTPQTMVPGCLNCGSYFGLSNEQRLFERSANGIDVRVYKIEVGYPSIAGGTAEPRFGSCEATTSLLVEVSDAGAVGALTFPYPSTATRPVALVSDQVVGVAEGSPMAVLAVRVGSGVSGVGARFGNGAGDEMAVLDGVAVLVAQMPNGQAAADTAARANVIAYGASGQQVQAFTAPQAPAFAEPQQCIVSPLPPQFNGSGTAGSGTAHSGSAKTSSVGSAPSPATTP